MDEDKKQENRYRHSQGKRLIEVRIKNTQQLFDSRDPAPFRERDLDDDFIEYVLSSVRELSISTPVKIIIYIEEPETADLPIDSIREGIRSYFSYQIELQRSELKSFMRRAQLFLVIGLVVLALCIGVAQTLVLPNPPGLTGILREGIVIFGWVSIWKPIEFILFDWYPLYEKIRFYKKMLVMEIEIKFNS
ncbi:MAG: hypothetical protein H7256_13715 [Bdellovibrio sp.]|nr:hypothetical protein [Bdellovibrio sp.]